MDSVVNTIRSASDSSAAAEKLASDFGLSTEQVQEDQLPQPLASNLDRTQKMGISQYCSGNVTDMLPECFQMLTNQQDF